MAHDEQASVPEADGSGGGGRGGRDGRLAHCLEVWMGTAAERLEQARPVCLLGIELIIGNVQAAVEHGENLIAREAGHRGAVRPADRETGDRETGDWVPGGGTWPLLPTTCDLRPPCPVSGGSPRRHKGRRPLEPACRLKVVQ